MFVNSLNSGMTIAMPGNMEQAMMMPSEMFLNRKSNRASAYAANVPMTSVRIVTVPATTMLLKSAIPKLLFGLNTSMKFWNDGGFGNGSIENVSVGRRNAVTII